MISSSSPKVPFRGLRLHQKTLPGIMLCVLLSVFGGGIWNVHAQEENVNLTVQVGFDGYCKKDQWLPIHVEVENRGSDLNVKVQASYENGGGEKSSTGRNLELPATSRKEFFLYIYIPAGYKREVNVTLLTGKKVLKNVKRTINCFDAVNTIFGVLADNSSTYDILNDVKPISGFVRVAQLEISDLPDQAQAWASLDALIVSNVDTGTLTPEQRQSLDAWIAGGGKLLVIGGTHWQGTVAGLKDFMPVDANTTRRVNSLSQLQAYIKAQTPLDSEAVLAQGQVRAEAQILVSQDGTPLIVQESIGFGNVYFLAADPALQPLSNWSGMKEVYQHLLGSKNQLPTWTDGSWYGYQADQALATIPELGLPSFFYICGVLVFYIVVIGPINYFILRRFKRRELAWATIPILVIIFTCLAYGTGFFYRGATPILNRLAVAQAWDGVDQAWTHALIGVYSPTRTKYDLETSEQFMFRPFRDGNINLQANDHWDILQQDSNMVMPDVRVEIGDMKELAVEGNLPALEISHDLVITVSRSTPMISGNITNKSQYTIKDAFLVTSGNWTRLGDLAPGATKTVHLSLTTGSNGPEFYNLSASDILKLNYSTPQMDVETVRRSALLDSIIFRDYGVNDGNWGIYLMGWVDQIKIPTGLKGQDFKAIDTLLYIDRLSPSVKIESGELRLPTSLFAWESSDPNASAYSANGIPPDGYTLHFQPAIPISFRKVKSITLNLTSNASFQDLAVSAWDYELKTWGAIPVTGNYTDIPEPNRYVGPGGEIKIRIESNRSDQTQIGQSGISVVVEP